MAWTIEDPIVVEGVKMAKISGYNQELDAFDLSECVVDGYDTDSERLELWLPHLSAAAFIADIDQWALTNLTSNVQRFFHEPLSPVQVARQYKPAIVTLGGEHPLLTARMSVNAPCRQLDLPDGRPTTWPGLVVNPVFDIQGLWFTEDACGLAAEVLELEYDWRMYRW